MKQFGLISSDLEMDAPSIPPLAGILLHTSRTVPRERTFGETRIPNSRYATSLILCHSTIRLGFELAEAAGLGVHIFSQGMLSEKELWSLAQPRDTWATWYFGRCK